MYVLQVFAGDIIGEAIGIGFNVGGVGFAMFLLLLATDKMKERGKLSKDISEGNRFLASHVYTYRYSNDCHSGRCRRSKFGIFSYSRRYRSRIGRLHLSLAFKLSPQEARLQREERAAS